MTLFSENYTAPIHQPVALSGSRKFCWEVLVIGHRKRDSPAGRTIRDWGSLVIGALGNAGARG